MSDLPSVTVLVPDALFPTNAGGRLAALNHVLALRRFYSLTLVVFHRAPISPVDKARHDQVAEKTHFIRRRSLPVASLIHPSMPYQMSSRLLSTPQVNRIGRTPGARPVYIAHQDWLVPAARALASRNDGQVILVSHNDEVRYMRELARTGSGLRATYSHVEARRIAMWKPRITRDSDSVAAFTELDAASYSPRLTRVVTIPPVLTERSDRPAPSLDGRDGLLFAGTLDLPNTVAGIQWFLRAVWPIMRGWRPDVRLTIAGRRASASLSDELASTLGITFLGEVADLEPLYSQCRVFINPIDSGSGVNMKLGPPAERGIPCVTTSFGARGLDALRKGLSLGDSAAEFARACENLMQDDELWSRSSENIRGAARGFTVEAVGFSWKDFIENDASHGPATDALG